MAATISRGALEPSSMMEARRGVTREEIEKALLTSGVVDIDVEGEIAIVLSASSRLLAEIVIARRTRTFAKVTRTGSRHPCWASRQ